MFHVKYVNCTYSVWLFISTKLVRAGAVKGTFKDTLVPIAYVYHTTISTFHQLDCVGCLQKSSMACVEDKRQLSSLKK